MTLTQLLIDLARRKLSAENDWYCWRDIKRKRLPAGVVLPLGNQYATNVALKLELHRLWLSSNDEERVALAQFYVSTWGGVRRNRPETLRYYVNHTPEEVIELGQKGIASWSKVLCIRDPSNYAIFGARVSVALNSLQLTGQVTAPVLFPLLPGQNETIKSGGERIRAFARENRWGKAKKETYYGEYIDLLRNTARECATHIYTIEMLLFAQAELLLSNAFPNEQF